MKSFFRFFAERNILATLITIMICLLGLSTLVGIKRDIFPIVDFGMMSVITTYPGASPEDVELNVTNKIEEELKSVVGLDNFTSFSMENVSVIEVVVDINEPDQDKIKREIREAVNRVTDFPAEVTESPKITELSTATVMPIIEVSVVGDYPYREKREIARAFEKKLKDVPGVSRLDKFGIRAREIRVEVDPAAVKKYQIPMREVIGAIQSRNIRSTTGSFESYTSEKNLVALAQFRDPLEVGDVIVRSSFDGPIVKVKDLAIVKDDFEDERQLERVNSISAITFVVFMNEEADVVRTCNAIKKLVEKEKERLPQKLDMVYSYDTSVFVDNGFKIVLNNGWIGLVLVLLLLPVFLNFRTAFWVAMGIPVAFLGTIFLLPKFDGFLDTITLSGMILVIGIIVDDAIIIAENITKHRESGDEPLDAAVNGINEVIKPVVTTVLTTFLVFAPMFFMPGVFGKFIIPIPLAISLALFLSLGEAAIALPAHLVKGMRKRSAKSKRLKWFRIIRDKYHHVVYRLLKFRYILVVIFILLLVGALWYAGTYMDFILFPSNTAEQFYILIELPTGTPLRYTSEKIKEIEMIVDALPEGELASFVTRIGTNVFLNAESENYAALRVDLTPYTERERNADEIVNALREITNQFKGFELINYMIESGGPPVGKPVSLRLSGVNDMMRKQLTDSVVAFLSTIDGVKDINRDDKSGKDQVEIKINYDMLSRLGLTVADVAQNVRIAYDGEVITSVRYGDEDVDFRVLVQEEARKKLSYLRELLIPNRSGRLIPLKQVATLKSGPGPADFRHYNGDRTTTVEAEVEQDKVTPLEVTDAIQAHFDIDSDWPGMELELTGEVFATQESMAGLMRTMLIAVLGIYFILVLLFNSMTQPFLVMAAIPFGIIGVIITFAFHGVAFSFMGMMGIIGLSGVVVNDSLVLVSFINNKKEARPDVNIKRLVAEGTADRLRAIIMTTLTTVAALLPLAYGIGGTSTVMAPMALALGWGLVFATPLTLVLVPCLYVIGDDLGKLFKKR